MTRQIKVNITLLKLSLLLIVLAVLLGTASSVLAAGGGGATPAAAVDLVDDVIRIDNLKPGEQHWFKFTPDEQELPAQIEQTLTLIFTPDDGNTVRYISLEVFEEDQLQFYFNGDTGKMANLGAGQIVVRDNNPLTGELLWTGWISNQKTYYVLVLNDSDFPIDYRLFTSDIRDVPFGEPEAPQAAPQALEDKPAAPIAAANVAELGKDPTNPAPLPSGTFQRKLEPHSTDWYTLSYPGYTENDKIQELDFSVFFTPDDGNRRHYVNFELYATSELEFWRRGDIDQIRNFGAGRLVSRDGDYLTGERIWRGAVLKNNTYLMAVENGTDVEIDYWVFDDDIYNPILGPQAPAPVRVFAEGAAPQTARPLKLGLNKGSLSPGEEDWYGFSITDFDNEDLEEMALTMVTTPDDGNRIRNLTFDVFTAGGVRDWSPGDNTQIENLGAGSVVYRDNNPLTGERFWHGWIIDNDLYLVQIRNGTGVPMDYWLYTGDVYGPELGEKTLQVARIAAAPGEAPGTAIDLKVGVNQGSLRPGQERWYVFSRGDVDRLTGSVETVFTMIFTPDDGNRVRTVNFELFEGNQLRDWAPDNRFNVNSFGRGSVVNRDGDLATGELLWEGHVLAGDLYYMRVTNESDSTVDYWIFPEDVINTNLVPE